MSDARAPMPALRIAACHSDGALAMASHLFDDYREHYGQQPQRDRTLCWLTEMVGSRMLTVFTAHRHSPSDSPAIGLATAHAVPASLATGQFWQLRDLFVLPAHRRQGVAAALVGRVREEALAAGARRLSLVTELDNRAALDLYRHLGFSPVPGLTSLSLDLTDPEPPAHDHQ